MSSINDSVTQNLLPVQAYFNLDGSFNTFIGQNMPFYATTNPVQSGLTITNSTIDSTTIGATNPSTGVFTNITTTTGQITTQPTGATDIVNLLALQSYAAGISWKQPVACATTTNITLSGLQTIDTYTTLSGDRVIVKNQSTSANNGIYIASSGAWTRSTDANTWNELVSAIAFIEYGSQAGGAWFCTVTPGGTLGITPVTWAQFTTSATYSAGTGLSLTGYTFSITNTGTAGTYGSASAVPVFVTNAQGQVTSVTNTSIAIANTQVSGLGTMSTQNANNVAITGGSINGTTIGASTASTVTGTTITANSSFSGPGTGLTGTATSLSIGGSAGSATTAGSVTNSVTFNNGGTGAASGTTFNGSVAQTISYNTIGAPSTSGTGASGTWGISISGNAATVTNGVYTTGSYSNPTWITSILGSIVSGAVASATTATNVAGGLAGSLPYQSGAGATTFLGIGSANYVLTSSGTAPQYVAQSTLSVGSATTATTATNLAGGAASQIPYQTASGTTAFITNGTTGQFLTSNGTSAPSWATVSTAVTISDQTSSSSTFYPLFYSATSGSTNTVDTSSTKLQYVPSTGTFTATVFSGAGTGLTGTASSLSIGGNAATATSATSATTSTNLAGGLAGYLPYQSAVNATTFLAPSTNGYILTLSSGLPTWAAAPATGVTITDDTSSSTAYYPLFARVTSGTATTEYTSSTKLNYTPSTGLLAATSFSGSGSSLTFGTGSLSLAGNVTHSGAFTQTFTATGNTSLTLPTSGYVISTVTNMAANPVTGTPSALNFLRGDGTWATPAGAGTVTSVAQTFTGGIISVSGSPIITAGTLALTVAGTSGGIPYFSSTSAWASSAALTQYGVVYGGGAGAAPVATAAGTTGQVLAATTSAAPSWTNISSLAITSVSGTTNQITASTTSGAVTLSLPTSITSGIAKAWVNFTGSSGSINQSFNVSSITRNGSGDYTLAFTNNLANANYAVSGSVLPTTSQTNTSYARCVVLYYNVTPSTSSFRFQTVTGGVGPEDYAQVGVAVFST